MQNIKLAIRNLTKQKQTTLINLLGLLVSLSTMFIISLWVISPVTMKLMTNWLQNYAYHTTIDWWIYAIAGAFAVLVTVLTVSIKSWQTASRNPVEALRYE